MRRFALAILVPLTFACAARPDAVQETAAKPDAEAGPSRAGTAEQRAELFDSILDATARREAFSPVKEHNLSVDVMSAMAAQREAFVAADTELELFHALVRLSCARFDRHLVVRTVDEGLRVERFDLRAPLRFAADFSSDDARPFVVDWANDLPEVALGDRIVRIGDRDYGEWADAIRPYLRYSAAGNLRVQLAAELTRKVHRRGPELYETELRLELERPDATRYRVTLPYLDPEALDWRGQDAPRYPGFTQAFDSESFALWDGRTRWLIQWHRFPASLAQDLKRLVDYAKKKDGLAWDVILDLTHARGGDGSGAALAVLSPKPFRGTFGNVRISDVLGPLRADIAGPDWPEPNAARLLPWLDEDVAAAQAKGLAYPPPTPFKLYHFDRGHDGTFQPAPMHFSGRLGAILGPYGGSNLDQFGAMIVDNGLAATVGMPLGGYSNTWEWEETLTMPGTGLPVASFMWSIGHTIRPNGEVLEGNPARPAVELRPTRENFRDYHALAIASLETQWRNANGAALKTR